MSPRHKATLREFLVQIALVIIPGFTLFVILNAAMEVVQ